VGPDLAHSPAFREIAMNIRTMALPAVAGLALGATPATAERQQQAEIRKVDCHVTFATYDSESQTEFQPVDAKGVSKAKPKAKASGAPRGTPLRPCIVLASA
jgi:hypothetical protein